MARERKKWKERSRISKAIRIIVGIFGSIFILYIGLIFITAIWAPSDYTAEPGTTSGEREITTPTQTTHSMNQNVPVDYLIYKVTKAETFTEMGSTFLEKTTQGKFVKVYLTITNNAKETKQIFTPRFTLVDNQGRSYDSLSDGSLYISDGLQLGMQLQPGLGASGAVVFEMPVDSQELVLVVRGDWLSVNEVKIKIDNINNLLADTTQQDEQDKIFDEAMRDSQSELDELLAGFN